MNWLFDFIIGWAVGRTIHNSALAAERASWTDAMKALAEREAAQPVLREEQKPLQYTLLAIRVVLMVLGMALGGGGH